MLYINIKTGEVRADINWTDTDCDPAEWTDRNDWGSFSAAQAAAEIAGDDYIAVDKGTGNLPRFDVVRKPQVGDEVSYAFNGDYYPDGEIVSVSNSLKVITTSTGTKYYRRKQTGKWIKQGGNWSLIHGHHSRWNPSF